MNAFANDPVKQRWIADNEKLLSSGFDLFNKDPSCLLSDEAYMKKVEEAQKMAQKMQEAQQIMSP